MALRSILNMIFDYEKYQKDRFYQSARRMILNSNTASFRSTRQVKRCGATIKSFAGLVSECRQRGD